jgi:5-methylcytosine-specific restriction endonuclease McrA
MPIQYPQQLSDRELLDATARAAGDERRATVELLRLLAELDSRRLYLGEGCSSLFTSCTQVLHLSEHAAYHRIEAARAARQFPMIFDLLADGSLTLTTAALLRSHLTPANHLELLANARHKSKREVEVQIARLAPKPDVRPTVRKVALPNPAPKLAVSASSATQDLPAPIPEEPPSGRPPAAARPILAPLAEDRYVIKVTVSAATHAKLRRAQDLLRHALPNGDPAAVLDRALTLLIDHLERTKVARVERPRRKASPHSSSRHVPAAVKRATWSRDQGRCAFEGSQGRCRETGHLEFHHLVPFADGGPTSERNMALRCRAHNGFESEQRFGPWRRE